ncbi:MAG TPA: hypothetical protein VGQ62_08660 [Chloroflexota bacterium]|jgi:hypothetical protein|nr:hypothetical protein [Chloroflexota bacterium]
MPTDPYHEDVELDESIVDLPPREALSIVDPGVFGLRNPMILGRAADVPASEGQPATEGESAT